MAILLCDVCNEQMHGTGCISETLVGFPSQRGHDHDDNCQKMRYDCDNGHSKNVSVRRSCPNKKCDWKGKTECFCHPDTKVDEWPEE